MARFYVRCPDCRIRMIRIAESEERFGQPETFVAGYYVCPHGCHWSYLHERNFMAPGIPKDVVEKAVRRGVLDDKGRLAGR